jgi:hypothetical protein
MRLLLALESFAAFAVAANWYDGIDGIKLITGDTAAAQQVVDDIYKTQYDANTGQFNANRYAVLLRAGQYPKLAIKVGYYTSIVGVGQGPEDVVLGSITSVDGNAGGGATQNFWRSMEGLTVAMQSCTWAVSQAAPIRRSVFDGDLWLSEVGPPHWSSGGFLADVTVKGTVHTGTQQQWAFRNADVKEWDVNGAGWNFVFVGTTGGTPKPVASRPGAVTTVAQTPRGAEKPYLVEESPGEWLIYVPQYAASPAAGPTANHTAAVARKLRVGDGLTTGDVFVARADTHDAAAINKGIEGKKGLLLTPGVYDMSVPLAVSQPGFVVLGLGFPTLVATGVGGAPALTVADAAGGVRVCGVLLEAGVPKAAASAGNATEPVAALLRWGEAKTAGSAAASSASSASTASSATSASETANTSERTPASSETAFAADAGVLSDVFTRVGAFAYQTPFHQACQKTAVGTMVELNTDGVVVDNTW